MVKTDKRSLRRIAFVAGVVPALVAWAVPVRADVTRVIEKVTGVCHYSAGTVEGAAAAVPPGATQTGIVCNVYENGVHIGGCGGVLNASAAACVGPAVGLGAPVICTYAWAVYPRATVEDRHCES
ncbi:MAG TPA: hypothetical protein VEU29_03595 [Actinomycetota bacterium]|nr:hypothetical protein [Actinomycetota bacterium]